MNVLVPTHGRPPTPGEILLEEFLKPMGLTQSAFAARIGVTYARVNEIVHGKRGISPETALRFARVLGTTPELWLGLQHVLDLYDLQHSPKAKEIAKLKPLAKARRTRTAAGGAAH